MNAWRYVRSFGGMPDEGPLPESLARQTRHAYFACVSYIDALVGDLIAALEETGASAEHLAAQGAALETEGQTVMWLAEAGTETGQIYHFDEGRRLLGTLGNGLPPVRRLWAPKPLVLRPFEAGHHGA